MILEALKVSLIFLQITYNLVCTFFTPVTVIFLKHLKIKELVRHKMGAEQRQPNRYEQRRIYNDKTLKLIFSSM